MDISLQATTVGLGPFQPAIKWNGRTWACSKEYVSEDEAVSHAQRVLTPIGDAINDELTREAFSTYVVKK